MIYNIGNDKLEPPKDDNKPKKLIDLNVVKKGIKRKVTYNE